MVSRCACCVLVVVFFVFPFEVCVRVLMYQGLLRCFSRFLFVFVCMISCGVLDVGMMRILFHLFSKTRYGMHFKSEPTTPFKGRARRARTRRRERLRVMDSGSKEPTSTMPVAYIVRCTLPYAQAFRCVDACLGRPCSMATLTASSMWGRRSTSTALTNRIREVRRLYQSGCASSASTRAT